jgi:hypothetical protein
MQKRWPKRSTIIFHFLFFSSVGNINYRKIVNEYKVQYLWTVARKDKGKMVRQVLRHLECEGYRFIKKKGNTWVDADEKAKRKKVVQALREKGPELRRKLQAVQEGTQVHNTVPSEESQVYATQTQVSTSGDGASVVSQDSDMEDTLGDGHLNSDEDDASLEDDYEPLQIDMNNANVPFEPLTEYNDLCANLFLE